jgi:hypothetical protein
MECVQVTNGGKGFLFAPVRQAEVETLRVATQVKSVPPLPAGLVASHQDPGPDFQAALAEVRRPISPEFAESQEAHWSASGFAR